jgi:preprotein translocase subunit SecF
MKGLIRFSRLRFIMIGLSSAIIISGIVIFAVKGLNTGIDFRGGMNQQIQIVPVAMRLSASGDAKVQVASYSGERQLLASAAIGFTVTKGAEQQEFRFPLAEYATMRDLVQAFGTVPGVTVALVCDGGLSPSRIFPVDFPVEISAAPMALNYALTTGDTVFATTEKVRAALRDLGDVELQTLGKVEDQQFLLKMGMPKGDNLEFRQTIEAEVRGLLSKAFSADEVIIRKTDYVGPSLAGELAIQTVSVIGVALVLMLIYLSLRFRFEYALACVLCVIHDSAVMVTVGLYMGVEFSTSVVAAILTIIGYSVNDTIVIFDRVREDVTLMRDAEERVLFDTALTQTLGRTIITSFATLLAVVALYVFTTGSLKDFSLMMIVGIVVGSYSTIYIASPIVMAWHDVAKRRQRRRNAVKFGIAAPASEPQKRAVAEKSEGGEAAEAAEGEAVEKAPAAADAAPEGALGTGEVVRQQPSRKKKKR